jgi:hypothetical protein
MPEAQELRAQVRDVLEHPAWVSRVVRGYESDLHGRAPQCVQNGLNCPGDTVGRSRFPRSEITDIMLRTRVQAPQIPWRAQRGGACLLRS